MEPEINPQTKVKFIDLLDKFINKKSKNKKEGVKLDAAERAAFTIENRKESILRMIDDLENLSEVLKTTHDPEVYIYSVKYGEPLVNSKDKDSISFTLMKDYNNIFMLLKTINKKLPTNSNDTLSNVKMILREIVNNFEFKNVIVSSSSSTSSSSAAASSLTSSSSAAAEKNDEEDEDEEEEEIYEGGGIKKGGCGCMIPLKSKALQGGYRATKRDKKYLKMYRQGKSIGFTMRSSLKAKGLIPRANGTRRVSNKYRNKK